MTKPDCRICQRLRAQHGNEPDCESCLPVQLLPANIPVVKIWALVQGQLITRGMSGEVIDINHLAIWEAIDRFADRFGIYSPLDVFTKIVKLFRDLRDNTR